MTTQMRPFEPPILLHKLHPRQPPADGGAEGEGGVADDQGDADLVLARDAEFLWFIRLKDPWG
jgi:hypothetical protein